MVKSTSIPLKTWMKSFPMLLRMESELSQRLTHQGMWDLGDSVRNTPISQWLATVENTTTHNSTLQLIWPTKLINWSSKTSRIYSQAITCTWVVMKYMAHAGNFVHRFKLSWLKTILPVMMISKYTIAVARKKPSTQIALRSIGLMKLSIYLLHLKISFSSGVMPALMMWSAHFLIRLSSVQEISCISIQESISFGAISLETLLLG